jgi:hypothetical protein
MKRKQMTLKGFPQEIEPDAYMLMLMIMERAFVFAVVSSHIQSQRQPQKIYIIKNIMVERYPHNTYHNS